MVYSGIVLSIDSTPSGRPPSMTTFTVLYEDNDINVDQGTEHHVPEPIGLDF